MLAVIPAHPRVWLQFCCSNLLLTQISLGARYLVNRPFLDYALHIMPVIKDGRSVRDAARDVHGELRHEADIHIFEAIQGMSESEIWRACRRCIEAAIQSTVAFDGVPEHDLIVTNIHGTAHA